MKLSRLQRYPALSGNPGVSGPQCHLLMPEAVNVVLFPTLCITKEHQGLINEQGQTDTACLHLGPCTDDYKSRE